MEADNARAGAVMRHIVGHDGAAGGHGTMAGARLFATVASEESLEATFQEMVRRLLEVLGHPPVRGEPLLRLSNPRQ
jgi:nanoRNase/pAp phosphatase (c-di-AMP/oligoRNAs hydrolase)